MKEIICLRKYWCANDEGSTNGMPIKIKKITGEYLEIGIHGKGLQVAKPHDFYINCSSWNHQRR